MLQLQPELPLYHHPWILPGSIPGPRSTQYTTCQNGFYHFIQIRGHKPQDFKVREIHWQ